MTTSCSIALLESALAGKLPPEEEASLHQHLEECTECGATLERLAGGNAWCREAAALLVEDELDEAVPTRDEWSAIDFTVEHLEPTDEPNVLGRLGGYDVLDIVGHGGNGVVLKAYDRELKRCVAIKVLAPHLARSSLAKKRFAREAQAAAAVVHPNVLAIHQVQPSGRLPFLVMPLVAGESLAQRLAAQGTLELKEILRIGMQAAAGLAAAHEQGLVHRDVKPANILLEKGVERAVLTDFGLARAADDATLTRWGIIAGTPQYMSPEQARGESLDGRSDLFSLGCVLYEMATGVSPFRTESLMATMRRLVDDSPQAMASLNPELPPWFIAIVDRLLEKEPAKRFNTAKEVSELLEGCLAHVQQPASVPLPPGVPKGSPTRQRGFFGTVSGWHNRMPLMRKIRFKLAIALLAAFAFVAWAVFVATADPPDIAGEWSSEDWGKVTLKAGDPGEYTGTYSETVGKQPGEIQLKWSRIERRFNGTWHEGKDRLGELSLHLVGDEIRGGLTTDAKSKINPATPHLADFAWIRYEKAPAKSDDAGQISFGPMVERDLAAVDEGKAGKGLNLATGELVDVPSEFTQWSADRQRKWSAENHLDLLVEFVRGIGGYGPESKVPALVPQEMKLRLASPEPSENATAESLRVAIAAKNTGWLLGKKLLSLTERQGVTYYAPTFPPQPMTFVLQTSDGKFGILDFFSFTGETGKPLTGMTIRYKLVQGGETRGDWSEKTQNIVKSLLANSDHLQIMLDHRPQGQPGRHSLLLSTKDEKYPDFYLRPQIKQGQIEQAIVRLAAIGFFDRARGGFHPPKTSLTPPAPKNEPGYILIVFGSEKHGDESWGGSFNEDLSQRDGAALEIARELRSVFNGEPEKALEVILREMGAQAGYSTTKEQIARIEEILQRAPEEVEYPAELFEIPPGTFQERLRSNVVAIPLTVKEPTADSPSGEVFCLTTGKTFYVQLDAPRSSQKHYYGPFVGDPAEKFGLTREPPEEKKSPPPTEPELSFGPVIECELPGGDAHEPTFFDLDTCKTVPLPAEVKVSDRKAVWEWAQRAGVDATDYIKDREQGLRENEKGLQTRGLKGLELLFARGLSNKDWDRITPQTLYRTIGKEAFEPYCVADDLNDGRNSTFAFRTREGGIGLLQILFPAKPDSVKFRYKLLVQTPAKAGAQNQTTFAPQRVATYHTDNRVGTIACSPDGKLIAIGNDSPSFTLLGDGNRKVNDNWQPAAEILDAKTGKSVTKLTLASEEENAIFKKTGREPYFKVAALSFSPDASLLAVGTSIGQVKLFDAKTGKLVRSLDDTVGKGTIGSSMGDKKLPALSRALGRVAPASLVFSPDGSLLAVGGGSFADFQLLPGDTGPGRFKLWEVKTGKLLHDLEGHQYLNAVAFSPDGKLLAGASRWLGNNEFGQGIKLWDPATGKMRRKLEMPDFAGGLGSIAFSPDGNLLAIGEWRIGKDNARGGDVSLMHVASGIVEWTQKVSESSGRVAFSRTGEHVIALAGGRVLNIFDTQTGKLSYDLHGENERWSAFAYAPQANFLAIGGSDADGKGIIAVWNLEGAENAGANAKTNPKDGSMTITAKDGKVVMTSPDGKTTLSATQITLGSAATQAATPTPREVVAAWLSAVKDGRDKDGWALCTRKTQAGASVELHELLKTETIEPLHQLANDSVALVISQPVGDREYPRVLFAELRREDGQWRIQAEELEKLDTAYAQLRGFHADPKAHYDVSSQELSGRWTVDVCSGSMTINADGTGTLRTSDPGGSVGEATDFRWSVKGDTLNLPWPGCPASGTITRIMQHEFTSTYADGSTLYVTREHHYPDNVIDIALLADPKTPKKDSHALRNRAGKTEWFYTLIELEKETSQLGDGGIKSATVGKDADGKPTIQIEYNEAATKQLAEITAKHAGKQLGFFVDGRLEMVIGVPATPSDGKFTISGNFTASEAARIVKHFLPQAKVGVNKTSNIAPKRTLRTFTDIRIRTVACSPDGKLIAVANEAPTYIFSGTSSSTGIVKPAEQGKREPNWLPTVEVLEADSGRLIAKLKLTNKDEEALFDTSPFMYYEARSIAFSPDSSQMAVGTTWGQVKIFEARTGNLVYSLNDLDVLIKLKGKQRPTTAEDRAAAYNSMLGSVESLAYSPDGNTLAVDSGLTEIPAIPRAAAADLLGAPGRVKLWDLKTGKLLRVLSGQADRVTSVVFSPDGKQLAGAGRWREKDDFAWGVKLWDSGTGELKQTVAVPDKRDPETILFPTAGKHLVAFSPDSKQLAVGAQRFDRDQSDHVLNSGEISLFDAASGTLAWTYAVPSFPQLGGSEWYTKPNFSPDGKRLAALCPGQFVRFLDAKTGKLQESLPLSKANVPERWNDVALFPSGDQLLLGGVEKDQRGLVEIWTVENPDQANAAPGGRPVDAVPTNNTHSAARPAYRVFPKHRAAVLTYSPDGKLLAVGGDESTVSILDAKTGELQVIFAFFDNADQKNLDHVRPQFPHLDVEALAFSPDSKTLAVGNRLGQVKVFDLRGRDLFTFTDPKGRDADSVRDFPRAHAHICSLAFSPDGKVLVTSGSPLEKETPGVYQPNPTYFSGSLKFWDAQTGALKKDLGVVPGGAPGIAFSPDGKQLASTGDGTVTLWDTNTYEQSGTIKVPGQPNSIAFSPDGKRLAAGVTTFDFDSGVGNIALLDLAQRKVDMLGLGTLSPANGYVRPVAFSPDGKLLVAFSQAAELSLWDVKSIDQLLAGKKDRTQPGESLAHEIQKCKRVLKAVGGTPDNAWNYFVLSPNGRQVAIGGKDVKDRPFVEVWNLEGPDKMNAGPGAMVPAQVGKIELLAVAKYPTEGSWWWKPDGSLLSESPVDASDIDINSNRDPKVVWVTALFRVPGGLDTLLGNDLLQRIDGGRSLWAGRQFIKGQPVDDLAALALAVPSDAKKVDFAVRVARGAWHTAAIADAAELLAKGELTNDGTVWHVKRDGKDLIIKVDNPPGNVQYRVALDRQEQITYAVPVYSQSGEGTRGPAAIEAWRFKDVGEDNIHTFILQTRAYEKFEFHNVALQAESGGATANPPAVEKIGRSANAPSADPRLDAKQAVLKVELEQAMAEAARMEAGLKTGVGDASEAQAAKDKVAILKAEFAGDPVRVAVAKLAAAQSQLALAEPRFQAGTITAAEYEKAKFEVDLAKAKLRLVIETTQPAKAPSSSTDDKSSDATPAKTLEIELAADGTYSIGGKVVSLTELDALLKQFAADHPGNQRVVLQADAKAAYRHCVEVVDICHKYQLNVGLQASNSDPAIDGTSR